MSPAHTNSKLKTQNSKLKRLVPRLLSWFTQDARDLPWRRTRDPYAIWISEIMLQQTQVKTVVAYWGRWMRELPTVAALANAKTERILKLWEGLGYYTRARNLQKAAQIIVSKHSGRFPEHFDEVLALPGIGRYTAGAICSIGFHQSTPVLDGNVIRVLCRLFGIRKNPRDREINAALWQLAGELVHHASRLTSHASPCSHLNQSLMELGALICTPRQPKCSVCPLSSKCVARRDGLIAKLPNLTKRAVPTRRRFIAFLVENRGWFLVRQRPAGVVNAGLWEFPNVEVQLSFEENSHPSFGRPRPLGGEGRGEGAVQASTPNKSRSSCRELERLARSSLGLKLAYLRPLLVVKHSITRYRITLEAHQARLGSRLKRNGAAGRWLPPNRLTALAFTSAHKKLLEAALRQIEQPSP